MNRTLFVRIGAAAAAGMIALTAYASVLDISLKRKPKVGTVSEYKLNATFQIEQGEVILSQKRVESVTGVKPDGGFSLKLATLEAKVSVGGQELPPQPDITIMQEVGPDGLVRTITSDAPSGEEAPRYRLANLHAFKAPDAAAKIGDEINFEIPADKKRGTPGVKSSYKVIATEKVKDWDCVKLTFTTAETEGETKSSIKGTIWLSIADGSLVKAQEEWKDVMPGGAPVPLSGKYNAERTK